ncbi:MAG TPA: hypothetical protein VHW45_08200, partial [Candidatus Sulfotelmatobacter sp.]|nr:hypothetical protein [Candidatus Sulfotelmatobacter sp.]
MKRILLILALLISATLAHAQDIAGDWQGTLNTGMGELGLVLHINKAADGALKATLDSVDQGSMGIPVSSIVLKDSKLNLTLDILHGMYEGKVAPDGKTISGTWSQGKALPLDFKRATAPIKTEHKSAKPSDIDGAWMGTLDLGTVRLRVVFHISNTEDGLTATLDSPDQNAKGMPTTSVTRDGMNLKIESKNISAVFEGKIAPDLSSIDGTFTQMGAAHPLVLKRLKDQAEIERRRPQNPTRPYPYREEEVHYDNKVQNVTLAATL